MPSQTLPPYALPLFGTFSVASILGLVVLLLKFREDVSKALVDLLMKSDKFLEYMAKYLTIQAAKDGYVAKESYRDHYSRLKHLEASCPHCNPLKETKGIRRDDL